MDSTCVDTTEAQHESAMLSIMSGTNGAFADEMRHIVGHIDDPRAARALLCASRAYAETRRWWKMLSIVGVPVADRSMCIHNRSRLSQRARQLEDRLAVSSLRPYVLASLCPCVIEYFFMTG